jgi:hypothetical protein
VYEIMPYRDYDALVAVGGDCFSPTAASAIFNATGKRIRSAPITPELLMS